MSEGLEELRAEVVRLRESEDEYEKLLTETAEALKGPPPPNVWHDWSDLPAVARLLKADRDSRERAERFRVDL